METRYAIIIYYLPISVHCNNVITCSDFTGNLKYQGSIAVSNVITLLVFILLTLILPNRYCRSHLQYLASLIKKILV